MLHIAFMLSLLGQSAEEPMAPAPAGPEPIREESQCVPIIQKFKGMALVQVTIDYESKVAKMVYARLVNKHMLVLFLVLRNGCNAPYQIVDAKSVDPNPEKCPEGMSCL